MATLKRILKFREWKFKQKQKHNCSYKWRHENILTAIEHCRRLEQEGDVNPVMFYHCELCGFAHVGHMASGEGAVMYGAYSENVRELQGLQARSA